MRILARLALPLIALMLPFAALALDASSTIKVTPLVKTSSSWNGKPLAYPSGQAEVTGLLIEIAAGAETGWHEHPVPSFAYVLSGNLEVVLRDGQVKKLKAGDAFAEVVETLHNGHAVGNEPVKLVVFYAGEEGKPLTIKHD